MATGEDKLVDKDGTTYNKHIQASSKSLSSDDSGWAIPFINFNFNIGSFGSFHDVENVENQTQIDDRVVIAGGRNFGSDSTLDEEVDSSKYFNSNGNDRFKPSSMGKFEEFFVKGLPKDFRYNGRLKQPNLTYPPKDEQRHRASFLIYASGQFVMFILLLVQYEHEGLLTAESWMLVLGIINIIFALFLAGYVIVNVYAYLVAKKLFESSKSVAPVSNRVWGVTPNDNHARTALWVNACWVLFGIISMGINFIFLVVERCIGNEPVPMDLMIIYATITLEYIIYAIFHRKLAYCCWYNWYRRYDENNSRGTWGHANNGNIKNCVIFAKFNETSRAEKEKELSSSSDTDDDEPNNLLRKRKEKKNRSKFKSIMIPEP